LWQVNQKVGDALGDCPFELQEGIKCDMLKFLKVSKVVSTFLKTYFQSTLKNLPVCLLWESRLKVGQINLIWNFHSYVVVWKGLGHDLMNQTHVMHFSAYQKKSFGCQIWVYGKLTFEGLHIVIIQKFKFQKMCIKVHNGSNISNTSFELFDLKNV
jgi:hypothetical protein